MPELDVERRLWDARERAAEMERRYDRLVLDVQRLQREQDGLRQVARELLDALSELPYAIEDPRCDTARAVLRAAVGY